MGRECPELIFASEKKQKGMQKIGSFLKVYSSSTALCRKTRRTIHVPL